MNVNSATQSPVLTEVLNPGAKTTEKDQTAQQPQQSTQQTSQTESSVVTLSPRAQEINRSSAAPTGGESNEAPKAETSEAAATQVKEGEAAAATRISVYA